MALEMKSSSRWWYARFMVNGKLRRFNLTEIRGGKEVGIEIKGRRPDSMKHPETGDAEFLASYHRALAAHDRLREDVLSARHVEAQAQRIIKAKTGASVDFVKIADMPGLWKDRLGTGDRSEQYVKTSMKKLQGFVDFMHSKYPQLDDLVSVRTEHVRAFLAKEDEKGISARTWNIMFSLLKTIFRELEPNADAYVSYLSKRGKRKKEHTVHREPFTEEEVEAILAAAADDDQMRPLIVTALCTAMRRGDCARLRWADVDLEQGFIVVQTSKTGETVEIPVLPLLDAELRRVRKSKSPFVFPKAAALYAKDRHALDRLLREVLVAAGFVSPPAPKKSKRKRKNKADTSHLVKLPLAELKAQGLQAISDAEMLEKKREKMRIVFLEYLGGKGLPTIAKEQGVSKSTASLYLHEVEDMTSAAVLRRPEPEPEPEQPSHVRGTIQAESANGQRLKRASLRGWHSFRVSFVTRALAGGMPEELVRRVTGHTAVDVVRKHYFKPGREEFRRQFERAMPGLLSRTASDKTRDLDATETAPAELLDEALKVLEGVTGKANLERAAKAVSLIRSARAVYRAKRRESYECNQSSRQSYSV